MGSLQGLSLGESGIVVPAETTVVESCRSRDYSETVNSLASLLAEAGGLSETTLQLRQWINPQAQVVKL